VICLLNKYKSKIYFNKNCFTCDVKTVTFDPVQLTANSRMESTDGVCELIFNVLPTGRNSLLNKMINY
jgi:hypothetical protein